MEAQPEQRQWWRRGRVATPSLTVMALIGALVVVTLVGALLVVTRSSDGESAALEPFAVEPFVQCELEGCVAEAVATSSGQLWLEHEDISADPVSGAIGLQRTYFREDTTSSSFGPGWRSILDTRLNSGDGRRTLTGFPSLPGALLGIEDGVATFADGTRWIFGGTGSLMEITTRAGRSLSIDRDGALVTILDGDNPLIEVAYKSGRVAEVNHKQSKDIGSLTYTYDHGHLQAVTSSEGKETLETYRYGYYPDGTLKQAIDAGGEKQIDWTDQQTVEQITVGGQTTTIQLPTPAQPATLVKLPGAKKPTEYRHDSQARLIKVRQGNSVSLRREYDKAGRLTLERDTGDERRYTWSNGQLSSVESAAHGTTDLEWDSLGRLAATRAGTIDTSYEYEGSTWAPSKVTEGDATTTYAYQDAVLVEVTDPDGVTTDVESMPQSELIHGAAPLSETRPKCSASNDGLVLDSSCRPAGLDLSDPDGDSSAKATITYDDYGRTASTTGPAGGEEFTYDARGRIASVKRGDVTFKNDYVDGRLHRVTTDNGDAFAKYGYDEAGRLESLESSHGSVKRSYDSRGRIAQIEDGGLVWEVTEYSEAGRPKRISTPYGVVAFTYDQQTGRVDRTEVGEHGKPSDSKTIATTYDWKPTADGDVATVSQGGYVSTLTFEDQKLTNARTPLGRWEYGYDSDHPDHLSRVSGPNGVTTYTYATGSDGAIRLDEMKTGDETRSFEWDDLGRLVKDEGGSQNRSFEYRPDGITQKGSSDKSVTWDETGLPATVESDGSTETWTWNPDRTLRSITKAGRGFPRFSDDQVWATAYDDDRRLLGFDKVDSDDDVAVTWTEQAEEVARPTGIARGSDEQLSLGWSENGELEQAALGDQKWEISRDAFRNTVDASRSGGSEGEISTAWSDGLPVGVSSGKDSLAIEECTETDCTVALDIDKRNTQLLYSEASITATSGDQETVFARDKQGLITQGCQGDGDEQACTDWLPEGKVGDRAELARFENLLDGTNGQIAGLVSRPLPLDAPALASLPGELRPEGTDIQLPDEELNAAIAAAAPVLPETYRLGADGAEVRLAGRITPTSVPLDIAPGNRVSVDLFNDEGLGEFNSPFVDDQPLGAATKALAGIEQDSILRGAGDALWRYGPGALMIGASLVIGFGASLFTGVAATVVMLGFVAGTCLVSSSSCAAFAVTGVLMAIPGVGPLGVLLIDALVAVGEGAVMVKEGASWQAVALTLGPALLLGLAIRTPAARSARPLTKVCGTKRVWCLDAAKTPEAAANAVSHRGRTSGVLTMDRAKAKANRTDALRGKPTRPGLDRDEFPPAATRQGGKGASVSYINLADNRSAGASFRHATSGLDDGQRLLYLLVDSSDRPLSNIESIGAKPALLSWREEG